jgi:hypothetical protein
VTDIDYLWQKQVRESIPGTEPVVCEEEEPPGEEPPGKETPGKETPAAAVPPSKGATPAVTDTPAASTASSQVAGPTVPTSVHAGLGEDVAEIASTRTTQGMALVGLGALMLLASGLGMVRQRGGRARIQA